LFLNGKSLGRKKKVFDAPNDSPLNGQPAYRIRWDDVAYEPGELKVIAYQDGQAWATNTVKTAGEAKRLELQPDRATITGDGHDISFVTLRILDQDGSVVPRSMNLIHFSISGAGEIIATDNGDATDLTAFPSHDRRAFNGLAMVIVKARHGKIGAITVTATSEGLKSARTKIKLK
jgi:beta-galactosidase